MCWLVLLSLISEWAAEFYRIGSMSWFSLIWWGELIDKLDCALSGFYQWQPF